jgi:L-lysine 2,3-aminomutase
MKVLSPLRLQFYTFRDLEGLPQLQKLPAEYRSAMKVVAHVLPFRTNNYVVEQLIDWDCVPEDPIFQLTFPQPGMLSPGHFRRMARALQHGAAEEVRATADQIRRELNPHPAGQLSYNVPTIDDEPVPGVQHKYAQTCLAFPAAGQTCHAYCTYCFRWAQFVGIQDLKFATDESLSFHEYLRRHKEVTDVLLTGGDPMVMHAQALARYIEPLLGRGFEHVQTIRIGTKALAYWPYCFLDGKGADTLLRLLEKVVVAGKHLAVMAHFSHWREQAPRAAREAVHRLQAAGAVIRTQAPLVRHVNDDAKVWARMWREQVRLGCVPYYMFVERDTGASRYFKVPLYRSLEIYREAIGENSGLGRTARGPVMSALPGKVVLDGVADVDGKPVFVLSFLQARDPAWCKRPFFAEFDGSACWLTELRPAFGAAAFFYERQLQELLSRPLSTRIPELAVLP